MLDQNRVDCIDAEIPGAAITIWNTTASFVAHTLLKELVKALQHYLQVTREGGGRE